MSLKSIILWTAGFTAVGGGGIAATQIFQENDRVYSGLEYHIEMSRNWENQPAYVIGSAYENDVPLGVFKNVQILKRFDFDGNNILDEKEQERANKFINKVAKEKPQIANGLFSTLDFLTLKKETR